MGFVGIEEIFLKVQDLDRAIDFYHNKLGIPLDKRDHERAYLHKRPSRFRTTAFHLALISDHLFL
jgi:catechol 2,3-dioxygenase-like lactoylglutathione lyase family enzyme